jgi:hypothetical protein
MGKPKRTNARSRNSVGILIEIGKRQDMKASIKMGTFARVVHFKTRALETACGRKPKENLAIVIAAK